MKTLKQAVTLCGLAAALILSATPALAQNQPDGPGGGPRGNFDPAQMRQRMMERMREQFGVTNDDEWKIISERIEKVNESRRGMGGVFGRMGRGPGGGGPGGGGRGGRGWGPQSSAEEQELQKAIEDKASNDVIKAKLAKVRDAHKASDEKLRAAQAELKEVLDTRQEAVAVLMGLLP
jgi:hypothetical protein